MEIKNFDVNLKHKFQKTVMKYIDIYGWICVFLSFISIIWVNNSFKLYNKDFYIIIKTVGIVILTNILNMNIYFLKKKNMKRIYIINMLIALLLGHEIFTFINFLLSKEIFRIKNVKLIQIVFSMSAIFALLCMSIIFYKKFVGFIEEKNLYIVIIIEVFLGSAIGKISSVLIISSNRNLLKVCFIIFTLEAFYVIYQGFKNYRLYEDFHCYCATTFILLQVIAVTHFSLYKDFVLGAIIFGYGVKVLSYIFLNIVSIICIVWDKELLKNDIRKKEDDEQKLNVFRDIIKCSKRNIIIINDEKNIVYANIGAAVMVDKSSVSVIGLNIYHIIKQYKNDIDFQVIEKGLREKDVWRGEFSLWKSKNRYFFKCEIIKICREKVEDYEYAILIEDFTENKILYEKLQKSEKRFIDMANNMLDFMIKVDDGMTMDFISKSYCNALGYDYKELRGEPIFRFIHEDDKKRVYNHVKKCLKTSIISHIEYRMKVKGGEYIWVESIGNIKFDHNNKIESAVITSRDISKRKYYENALIESERKYREFFNMVPNYIYVVPLDDDIIEEVNNSMKEDFIGEKLDSDMNIAKVFGGENAQMHYRYFYEVLRGKRDVEFEFNVKNIKDEKITLQVSINPIYDEERIVKILCMARDITDKRKIEELQIINESDRKRLLEAMEYDRIKTEFFANISHELRTPINVILAAIQLDELEERKNVNSEKKHKNRNVLKQNCFRLLRLINNLIDLTKIDSGYFELNLTNYDMVYIIENIVQSIVPYAKNKNITMVFDTNVEEKIMAIDLDKIERVILNLISNAIKFTPSGGEIYVNLIDRGKYVEIHIKDTGRGIPGEKLDFIFERFRQVDKSLSRDHEGSGIGLYLVKSLVELHEGKVWVSSSLGRGSNFVIQLPCNIVENNEVAAALESDLYKSPVERIRIELSDIYEI